MKKRVLFIIVAILIIIDVIITKQMGVKVALYYGEGYTLSFKEQDTINLNDIREIAKEIWGNSFIVQNVEFFKDSAIIKVKKIEDGQVEALYTKLNEKYGSDLNQDSIKIEHVSNIKVRTLVEPYIAPVGLSLFLVIAYYAARYKGIRQMIDLFEYIGIGAILLYSMYAIFRIPFSSLTMPIFMTLYITTTLVYTIITENKFEEEND